MSDEAILRATRALERELVLAGKTLRSHAVEVLCRGADAWAWVGVKDHQLVPRGIVGDRLAIAVLPDRELAPLTRHALLTGDPAEILWTLRGEICLRWGGLTGATLVSAWTDFTRRQVRVLLEHTSFAIVPPEHEPPRLPPEEFDAWRRANEKIRAAPPSWPLP